MFDLKNLTRWKAISKSSIAFKNEEARKVRLEVLAEGVTVLRVGQGKGTAMFIGKFEGYDVVQFQVDGPWTLQAEGDRCFIWTPELESYGGEEIPDAVSFTKIMTRRQRNPELELLMKKVGDNMERRIAQVQNDVGLQLAEQRRAHARELEDIRQSAAREEEERLTAAAGGANGDGEEDEDPS